MPNGRTLSQMSLLAGPHANPSPSPDSERAWLIRVRDERDVAEQKAWVALGRYKFQMFGYWAAIWVHLNRISGEKSPNPFTRLVTVARQAERGRTR